MPHFSSEISPDWPEGAVKSRDDLAGGRTC